MTALARMLITRDTAADFTSDDPVLRSGEIGIESDTGKLKFGDGVTAWTGLAYVIGGTDSAVVHIAGTETITGAKTFSAALAATAGLAVTGALSCTGNATIGDANTDVHRINGTISQGKAASAWGSSFIAIEQRTGSMAQHPTVGLNYLFGNSHFDGTNNKYYEDGFATRYYYGGFNGAHTWSVAPSGLAGATATFADLMVLTVAGLAVTGAISATTTVKTGVYTVAGLPAAGTKGRRAFVSDAVTQAFGGTLTGGGAVNYPVYDDGTIWRIG